MNIGEKIALYKERLGFRSYQEFGKAVGISGDWILELSKKTEVKFIDMGNLIKLSEYLLIPIEQLVKDTEDKKTIVTDILNINVECNDIGIIISELILLLNKENLKLDDTLLNDKAKEICKDSLGVVREIIKQYL